MGGFIMKKKYYMTLDTETVLVNGKQLVYDIAYSITDSNGIAEKSVNVLIHEIYIQHPDFFQIDTYDGQNIARKRKEYNDFLMYGTIKVVTFQSFIHEYLKDLEKYNIDAPAAYNCTFDCRSLSDTANFLNISKHPFEIVTTQNGKKVTKQYPFKDLYIPCKDLFLNNKKYIQWAEKYGFISPTGKIKCTAETVYSFLTKNPAHIEKHKALSDVVEESFIYFYLRKKKVVIDKKTTTR